MGDFDWKIWFDKLSRGLAATLVATGLIYIGEYVNATELPYDQAFWGGLIATLCVTIGNAIKHQYLVD